MPIIKTTHKRNSSDIESVETLYKGRVVEIEKVQETRNHSDTMDYTDYRTTNCIYALVWLGKHGIPPIRRGERLLAHNWDSRVGARDLEPGEQFGWVDCTGMWIHMGVPQMEPAVDGLDMQLLFGGPDMLDALASWKMSEAAIVHEMRAEVAARKARYEEEQAKAAAKKKAREDKKATKEAGLRSESEKLLARIPAKGTTVTVDGFTGTIFWTGVSKYYGKFSARAGVKDSMGNVQWIDAEKF